MTSQTKPRPYPRAVVRNVEGGHSIRLSHNPEYYFDVANVYPTYDLALADAAAWVRVERAKDKSPQPVAGPAVAPPPVEGKFEVFQKIDGRKLRQRKPIPEKCPQCHRPIRRPNDKVADYPGTVPMAIKDGTCQRCHKQAKNAPTVSRAPSPAPAAPKPAPAPKPKPPAKPAELIPITPEPRHIATGCGLLGTPAAPGNARQSAPEGHIVTVLGSGPLATPGPSDPVERDRASLDAYLKRRGRDGGAETAVERQGRGPALPKAGI